MLGAREGGADIAGELLKLGRDDGGLSKLRTGGADMRGWLGVNAGALARGAGAAGAGE